VGEEELSPASPAGGNKVQQMSMFFPPPPPPPHDRLQTRRTVYTATILRLRRATPLSAFSFYIAGGPCAEEQFAVQSYLEHQGRKFSLSNSIEPFLWTLLNLLLLNRVYTYTAGGPCAEEQFAVQSYLEHQGNKFLGRFDANAYVRLTQMIDSHDVNKYIYIDR